MDQQRYLQEKFHGLDANFINPNTKLIVTGKNKEVQHSNVYNLDYDSLTKINTHTYTVTMGLGDQEEEYLETNYGYSKDKEIEYDDGKVTASIIGTGTQFHGKVWRGDNGKAYVCNREDTSVNNGLRSNVTLTIYEGNYNAVDPNGSHVVKSVDDKTSTAGQLQSTISTWYKTLRMIAIVGLLSVLVYVGIRILISSTGQDKAKYKKMLADWVAAMCILFLLQYVMVFTMEMTDKVVGIFDTKNMVSTDENGSPYDSLITTVREKVGDTTDSRDSFAEIFSYIVIYIVLVIYTMVFLWQYLKRVVMLAFLTMIAPLIALTYPLDKIKDGQAQAFSMWIREYVFNALLPVIHTIIYYMLVSSAINFIVDGGNWLYAIVAVGFMMPAEKFFRKMFGFDKATSVGQLGAAAGGAMVMNAINKMTHKPPKEEKEKERKVRTTSSGGYSAGGGYSGNNATGGNNGYGNGNGSGGGNSPDPTAGTNPPLTTPLSGSGLTGGTPPTRNSNTAKPKRSIANGVTGLRKKYINRKTPKKIGKLARRGITGAAGAALLGTFGLAAGIASGDVSNVGKYATAGLAAGGYTGMSIGDKAAKIEKENREAFRRGMWGEDEYKTQELIKQIWEDDEIYEQYGGRENKDQFKADIREFYEGGVKGENEVTAALKMKNKNGITNADAVTIAQLNRKISNSSYGDPTRRKKFEQDIATSLRNQGYQGDVDKEAARQIKMIGDLKNLLDK
ncbi:MAG: hypothetical protein ACI4VO_04430 [Clostridia bacterium]